MKNIISLVLFMMSVLAYAEDKVKEFDRSEEAVCHHEYKNIGCVNVDDQEVRGCIEKRLNQVSPQCQSIHWEKKKKK